MQVMEARERTLGGEHPDTLTAKANLAVIYRNQGRWKEAEQIELQVMEAREKMLGGEHPDVTGCTRGRNAGEVPRISVRAEGNWVD